MILSKLSPSINFGFFLLPEKFYHDNVNVWFAPPPILKKKKSNLDFFQGARSKKDEELRDKSVPYFQHESGPCPLDWRIIIDSNAELEFFLTILTYMSMLTNCQNHISLYGGSPIQGTKFYSC